MRKVLFSAYRNIVVLFVAVCVSGYGNVSLAQCSTTTPPTYSVSCLNQYFTSITASGTGVATTISYTSGSCSGTYFDYYATEGIVASGPGITVTLNISRFTTTYTAYLSTYVDWNNNGIYEATELAGTMMTLPSSVLTTTYSFTIPSAGVVYGTNLHMRIMLSEVTTGAPCTANYGTTCDYYMNVTCPPAPTITVTPPSANICSGGSGVSLTASGAGTGGTYSWSPSAGLSSSTGATVTANPGSSAVYTVTGTVASGCVSSTATVAVNVNPMPSAISGATAVCEGATIPLSNTVAGGTWSSSATTVATIDASGVVYGVLAGSTTISYSTGSGCTVSIPVTVNISPSSIIGPTGVCAGAITNLSNSVSGGVWSSSNTSVATITGTGVVWGVATGITNISYTIGSCSSSISFSVNSVTPITGGTTVCAGLTLALSDATPGGVWSSANTLAATVSSTGVVYGVTSGSAAIIYTVGACNTSVLITVGFPVGVITGPSSVCAGSTITLSDGTPGGGWSSDNNAVATVTGGGIVVGVSGGTATISYSNGGCAASITVTVSIPSAGTISGKDSICIGPGHEITLSDDVAGGVWSSTNTAKATIDPATGVVTGVATGVDTIKYTVTNDCGTYTVKKVIHVRTPTQCATAAEQVSVAQGINVYPNPNTGSFSLLLQTANDEDAYVIITNVAGQKVKEFNTATNQRSDISLNAPQGVYLLTVKTAHDTYVAKVVVY